MATLQSHSLAGRVREQANASAFVRAVEIHLDARAVKARRDAGIAAVLANQNARDNTLHTELLTTPIDRGYLQHPQSSQLHWRRVSDGHH